MTIAVIEAILANPSFASSTTAAVTFSATPSNGEFLLFLATGQDSGAATFSMNNSVTSLANDSGTDPPTWFFKKVASSEAGTTYTVTASVSLSWINLVGVRISGADTTTPIDVSPVFANVVFSSPVNASSITTVTNGALHFVGCVSKDNTASDSLPSGYTSLAFPGTGNTLTAFYFPMLAVKAIATAGSTGAQAVSTANSVQETYSLAVRPASSGAAFIAAPNHYYTPAIQRASVR